MPSKFLPFHSDRIKIQNILCDSKSAFYHDTKCLKKDM